MPASGPLSYNQLHRLFQDQHEALQGQPPNPHFTTAAFVVRGPVDVNAFRKAVRTLPRLYPLLDTILDVDGGCWHQPAEPRTVPVHVREACTPDQAARVLGALLVAPMPSRHDPLIRAAIVLSPQQAHLGVVVDHVVSDGWSLNVVLDELALAYRGLVADAPQPSSRSPAGDYREFARREREALDAAQPPAALQYWLRELGTSGPVPRTELPGFSGLTAIDYSAVGRVGGAIEDDLWAAVRTTATRLRLSAMNVVLAALHQAIRDLTGQHEVATTLSTANRTDVAVERSAGWFASKIVIRTSVGGNVQPDEQLRHVKRRVAGALDHGEVPWPKLIHALDPRAFGRQTVVPYIGFNARSSAFTALFPRFALEGCDVQTLPLDFGWHDASIGVSAEEGERRCRLQLTYKTDWYPAATVELLLATLLERLQGLTTSR